MLLFGVAKWRSYRLVVVYHCKQLIPQGSQGISGRVHEPQQYWRKAEDNVVCLTAKIFETLTELGLLTLLVLNEPKLG